MGGGKPAAENLLLFPERPAMHNAVFHFRRFSVRQDRCAMKVGTDGVLLGAWVEAFSARRILDIGTGTGLIALMLAQRFERATIDAIEIDGDAFVQARENAARSPWGGRIRVHHAAFQDFDAGGNDRYGLLVSNPPYFVDSLAAPSTARAMARHANAALRFDDLLDGVHRLLAPRGRFCVILPAREAQGFIRSAAGRCLFLRRLTRVRTKQAGQDKRHLLCFSDEPVPLREDTLVIRDGSGGFTDEYVELTKAYYPRMRRDAVESGSQRRAIRPRRIPSGRPERPA